MTYSVVILLGVTHLSLSAMVLPRPPSSQNHIRQDQEILNEKYFEGKSLQSLFQSASVERPDTEDYRFLEIELQRPDEIEATNFQTLVRAILKPENESYPNPEVVANSVLGVRNVGLSANLRASVYSEDKHILLQPSKLRSLDEKLYYLKNGRPKVYVNVRGNSGSFSKNSKTTAGESLAFLRVTRPFQSQTDSKTQQRYKKVKIPNKHYNRLAETIEADREKELLLKSELNKAEDPRASVFSLMEEYTTTETTMVTSSELPKQIPAPPSKLPAARASLTQTTPIQRYPLRRTDVLPSYGFFQD